MARVKRAILVAAGIGKRMQPVTFDIPKPLIPVRGTRIMDNTIRRLRENGIRDIIIIAGYKKECFDQLYGDDPHIRILENRHYLEGNNITSLYEAREYLPESFVLEGDLIIRDSAILRPEIDSSGYLASWMEDVGGEWLLEAEDGKVRRCVPDAHGPGYRLWGISMWTKEDGKRLSSHIAQVYEAGEWAGYWDEIALFRYAEAYSLGIRDVPAKALQEIDTFEELSQIDPTYAHYRQGDMK